MASLSIRFGIDYKLMKKGRYFCRTCITDILKTEGNSVSECGVSVEN
jgi:hypothetical protein